MERITRFRVQIMLLLILAVLGFYAWKIYDLQIVQADKNSNNLQTFTTETRVKAARGEILDRNGNILVGNRASYDLVVNHYVLESASGENIYLFQLTQLCQEMGIEYEEHFPITKERPFTYTLETYSSSWQGYFQEYLSTKNLDSDITAPLLLKSLRDYYDLPTEWTDEQARAVIGIYYEMDLRDVVGHLPLYVFITDVSDADRSAILELNIPGMNVESSVVREYYTSYAAHILGNVGKMDAEQWEYYKTQGYPMDAEVGQSGLELAMEQYLHGTDGTRIDVVTKDGTIIESHYEVEPQAGNNVAITIDLNLQMAAEDSLAARMESLSAQETGDGHDAQGAALVAMDPKTGQVLACASYPTFDLAHFNEKYDEIVETPNNPLINRALNSAYPPGSSYKMSMVIAAIDSGVIDSTTTIFDNVVFNKYTGLSVSCLGSHGTINAKQALMYSCNYFFYELGDRIRLSAMDNTAKGLGLGEPTGVELPEEIGHRANDETKMRLHGERMYAGDMVVAAIGQSDNAFTPMQLAVYASTLANKGTRYKATFLNRVVSTDYRELVLENLPTIQSTMEISDEAFLTYSEGMNLVTTQGTASLVFRGFDIPVAGKTGTAETFSFVSDNGAFVCYAPYTTQPGAAEIAIAVYGERAGHGTTVAYVARDVLEVFFADRDTARDTVTYENQPN